MRAAAVTSGSWSVSKNVSNLCGNQNPILRFSPLLAERLGRKEEFTDGKSEVEWVKAFFDSSDLPELVSWEAFNEKGYHIINIDEKYTSTPALRWYAEGRDCDTPDPNNPKRGTIKGKELGTYSGKIEFSSKSLKEHFPNDDERPVSPHYIESWEGHHSAIYQKYPLQLLSPPPPFLLPLPL